MWVGCFSAHFHRVGQQPRHDAAFRPIANPRRPQANTPQGKKLCGVLACRFDKLKALS